MRLAIPILAVLTLVGCTSVGPMPSASTTTSNPAWEHYFTVAYDVSPQGEARKVSGYVHNSYGVHMKNVRLLVQGLDTSETVVAQQLAWVPGGVPGFGRSYFEVGRLPAAEKYRVTVWSFERVESGSSGGAFP